MSDDKKNVFSLVGGSPVISKEQIEKNKIKAMHKPHLEELFAQFEAGTHRYLILSIDSSGFASYLTDMNAYQLVFEVEKVKLDVMLPADDDIEE